MARHVRVEYPGAIYHVTVRMLGALEDRKVALFWDDKDHERFLDRLSARVEEYEIRLYAYCLMRNHFHLVVETPRTNLGRFMGSLNTSYVGYYNRRHRRRGHLTQGRYGAKLVEGDAYLLSLSRYVHLNPVHVASLSDKTIEEKIAYLRGYRWSSYPGYSGRRKADAFLDEGPILAGCGRSRREQHREYRQYVEGSVAEEDGELLHALKASALGIGGAEFLDALKARYIEVTRAYKTRDDVSFRHVVQPLPPGQVLSVTARGLGVTTDAFLQRRRNSLLRGIAGRMLTGYAGLTQRGAGALLGVQCGSGIARQAARVAALRKQDRRLNRKLGLIEAELDVLRASAQHE